MLSFDSHTSQGGKGELLFYGEKGPVRLRSRTEETQLHLGLLTLAQALGLQLSCQYDVIISSAPCTLPASPPASLCNEFHLLLLKLGKLSDTGSGLTLPRGSRCLLGAEIAFWALSFPHQLLRPTADVGRGVSRAARIRSTHVTQGGVAETRAKEDRLQVSDSTEGGGKQGKKRGAVAEPRQDLGRPLGR